jgi:hypothetical protein
MADPTAPTPKPAAKPAAKPAPDGPPEAAAGIDAPDEGQWPDRYFKTTDGVLARLGEGGWRSQVWMPSRSEWVDYPELDVAGECTEIPEADALALTSGEGEFAGGNDAASSGEGGGA